jgi:hypothetical protein
MSATRAGAVTAIAFELMNVLDAYAREAAQLTCERVDPGAYHRMRMHFDAMRGCVQDMPGLGAGWVELLIRHFELAHVRWEMEQGQAHPASVELVACEHAGSVQRLRTLCALVVQRDAASIDRL